MDIQGLIAHWLNDNKQVISIRALEKELEMPPDTLQKVIQGNRKIPMKWLNPLIKYIDKFTESWLFPKRYRKYLEHEGEDFFEYLECTRNFFSEGKRKRRKDYIPKLDHAIAKFSDNTWAYRRQLIDIIKLTEEMKPTMNSSQILKLGQGLAYIHIESKALIHFLDNMQREIKKEGLEQTTEIY